MFFLSPITAPQTSLQCALVCVFNFCLVFDQWMFFFLLYTIILNTGTKTGCDCNARPGIICIFLFYYFLFQIMSDATGMLLVMKWSIFKNSLLVACRALDQLETRTNKSNIKTTRNWPRLTHYLHTVTLTSIVHILQSEQKGYFSLGLVFMVRFYLSFYYYWCLSYLLWNQWKLLYGNSFFWMGECVALPI